MTKEIHLTNFVMYYSMIYILLFKLQQSLCEVYISNCVFENNEYAAWFAPDNTQHNEIHDTIFRGTYEYNMFEITIGDNILIENAEKTQNYISFASIPIVRLPDLHWKLHMFKYIWRNSGGSTIKIMHSKIVALGSVLLQMTQ